MKILYLITELDIGGAERTLYHLSKGASQDGHQVEVACLSGHGEVGSWIEKEGIPVHYLDIQPYWPPSWIFPLRRLVKSLKPDVLHCFLFHANIFGRLIGWWESVPAVICSVRVEDVDRTWRLRLDGWTSWMFHAETCVSESARRFTHKNSGIALEKLVAIPNGIDIRDFNLKPGKFRDSLGIDTTTLLLVSVGRLEHQKGMNILLEAISEVIPTHFPQTQLMLIGTGPDEEALKTQSKDLGLENFVQFLGWRSDVPQILVDADVFILASQWEGMPNVILESMSARCAVITTDVGGCPELVTPEINGLLVPPFSSKPLANAIKKLLASPKKIKEMGEAGRAIVENKFGRKKMIQSNLDLYNKLF